MSTQSMWRNQIIAKASTAPTRSAYCRSLRPSLRTCPTRYRADAATKLRRSLAELFAEYEAKLTVIIIDISVFGSNAFDYGWHELTLTPRNGGEPVYRRTRYCELWSKQPNGDWRISRFMDNPDVPDT